MPSDSFAKMNFCLTPIGELGFLRGESAPLIVSRRSNSGAASFALTLAASTPNALHSKIRPAKHAPIRPDPVINFHYLIKLMSYLVPCENNTPAVSSI